MNKEIEKVLGELKSIIRKLNGVAYGKEYMIPHEHNLFNKIRQHITNQQDTIKSLDKTNKLLEQDLNNESDKSIILIQDNLELRYQKGIIQFKLDKIQKIIDHADEVGLDLVYYKDIKKVLEEKLNKSFWKSFEETGTIIEVGECDKQHRKTICGWVANYIKGDD